MTIIMREEHAKACPSLMDGFEGLRGEPYTLPSNTCSAKVVGRSHLYKRVYLGRLDRRRHSSGRRRCNSTFSDTDRCRPLRSVHRPCIDLPHICLCRCKSCCLRLEAVDNHRPGRTPPWCMDCCPPGK